MSVQVIFLPIAALAVFIIVPMALILVAIEQFHHKASERPTGGPLNFHPRKSVSRVVKSPRLNR
ncbi:MAG TPA: hypothetical protein VGM76_01975 [Lacipirellulaceae bacterium]|jgi:hypothetical protein